MHRLEIAGDNTYLFPDSIQEINDKQYLYFIKIFLQLVDKKIELKDFKLLLVCELLKVKKSFKWFWLSKEKKAIAMDNLKRVAETMDSFLTSPTETSPPPLLEGEEPKDLPFPSKGGVENPTYITMKTRFTKNPLPKIGNLYGPDDILSNCTGYEYKEALTAYKKYRDTEDIEFLNELMAILYREKKRFLWIKKHFKVYNGQIRREFTHDLNPYFKEKRIQKVSKLPFYVKYGVLIIFQSFVDFMSSGEVEIDGNKIDLSSLYEKGDDDQDSGIGMIGLFYELAESKVFGNLNDVMNTNIYDILMRVYQLVQINKKAKLKNKEDDSN